MVPPMNPSPRRGICYVLPYILMITTRTKILVITFGTMAFLHVIALKLSLYWHFWWFDMPMHFLGGAIVALGLFFLIDIKFPLSTVFERLPFTLLAVLAVALAWEYFELWAGIPIESDYVVDTLTDLVMGLSGGYVGYYLARALGTL